MTCTEGNKSLFGSPTDLKNLENQAIFSQNTPKTVAKLLQGRWENEALLP